MIPKRTTIITDLSASGAGCRRAANGSSRIRQETLMLYPVVLELPAKRWLVVEAAYPGRDEGWAREEDRWHQGRRSEDARLCLAQQRVSLGAQRQSLGLRDQLVGRGIAVLVR